VRAWWVLLLVTGCYRPAAAPGSPCSPTGQCPSGQSCVAGTCVLGDAGGDACPATACVDDQITDCTGTHACAFGCATGGPPHCLALVPSNGITTDLLAGATADVTAADVVFDTETGEIEDGDGGTLRPPGEGVIAGIRFAIRSGMGVFAAHAFVVDTDAVWDADGENALVLFAADRIDVGGSLDAGGDDQFGGPGGADGANGGPASSACTGGDGRFKMAINASAGGGGGGGATAGGAGAATMADANGATSGGAGGIPCSPPSATPLVGGNGGGAAGSETGVVRGGPGGGAGGAVALVAMNRITVSGAVAAPGGGGGTNPGANGGGGGGGGGAVLLESPSVSVFGALTANGGGGGPPGNTSVLRVFGQRGHVADEMPATGGAFNNVTAGNGGAALLAPTAGNTLVGGAGGGGAAGAIHVRSTSSEISGITSPPATTSQATLE